MIQPYFVCTTPRSGSTLLCEALTLAGVAGRPAEYFEAMVHSNLPRQPLEYFDGVSDPLIAALLPTGPTSRVAPELAQARSYGDYLAWVRRQATPNEVFGAKLMWGHLAHLIERLGGDGQMPLEAIGREFPGARYVRVLRTNKLRQAISLWKALQTQRWRDDGEDTEPADSRAPEYHFGAIDHLAEQLTRQEEAWDDLFARAAIVPLNLTFDELADDLPGAVERVLGFLGVDARSVAPVLPGMRRQADMSSLEWVQRYTEDRERLRAEPVV